MSQNILYLIAVSGNLIFFIGGILQAVVLSALVYFHPRSDKSVNLFLSLYIVCVSILMLIPVVQKLFHWHAILYLMPFPLLIGPFLYLYVRSFKERITWRKAWPHFVLFFIFLITDYLFLPSLAGKSPATQQVPEEILLDPSSNIRIIIRIIRNVQMIVYYFLALKTLMSYQKSIHHLFSDHSRIGLTWLKWVINGYLFLIISLLLLFYFVIQYPDQFDLLIVINMVIIIPHLYIITFKGLTQTTLWQVKATVQNENIEKEMREAEEIESDRSNLQKIKTQKPGPAGDKIAEITAQIAQLMQREKLYQEPELTLQDLANRLQYPSHQVSQVINEGMKMNFYEMINGYRVEEAKRLLLDPKNRDYTILSVGFAAGFNSKTTFNTVFKKFTGVTPTEFRAKEKLRIAI